ARSETTLASASRAAGAGFNVVGALFEAPQAGFDAGKSGLHGRAQRADNFGGLVAGRIDLGIQVLARGVQFLSTASILASSLLMTRSSGLAGCGAVRRTQTNAGDRRSVTMCPPDI